MLIDAVVEQHMCAAWFSKVCCSLRYIRMPEPHQIMQKTTDGRRGYSFILTHMQYIACICTILTDIPTSLAHTIINETDVSLCKGCATDMQRQHIFTLLLCDLELFTFSKRIRHKCANKDGLLQQHRLHALLGHCDRSISSVVSRVQGEQ